MRDGDYVVEFEEGLKCCYCGEAATAQILRSYCNLYICEPHYAEKKWAL